jgi:hypothetical protein
MISKELKTDMTIFLYEMDPDLGLYHVRPKQMFLLLLKMSAELRSQIFSK